MDRPNPRLMPLRGWVIRYLAIPIIAALVITGATYFVGEPVVASVPGFPGSYSSAWVSGFPLPFATLFCCGGMGGPGYFVSLDNTYYYNQFYFVSDFAIW